MAGSRPVLRLALVTTAVLVVGSVSPIGPTAAAPAPEAPARPPAAGSEAPPDEPTQRAYDEFIVKFRAKSEAGSTASGRADALEATSDQVGVDIDVERTLATGATLVETGRSLGAPGQERLIEELESRPDVLYAVPNEIVYPTDEPPDPRYYNQWHYGDAGARLPHAWSFSKGSGVTVAVIDTGRTDHPDLNSAWVAGYDFISDTTRARDGGGRDSNPVDEGDWRAQGECSDPDARNSTWHGTHVAGTVGARWNSTDGAGVAPLARIQPVRVLGRCGGETADIVDAVTWASGGSVSGVPANGTPADVINMSIGATSIFECNNAFQDAANAAVGRGTAIVVSAGNDDTSTENGLYTACSNVIVVGATDQQGGRAIWNAADNSASNHGEEVDVSAPGTEVWSTMNDGTQQEGNPSYDTKNGTSMAAPHVAGLVAMVKSAYPSKTPAQIESALKSSARPLSDGCSDCGAGIIDATQLFIDLAGPVTTNTSLAGMFNNYANGSGYSAMCDDWSGGDGTQSIYLPSGKRAWFFSDSYLGDYRLRAGGFSTSGLRNAIVVQSGSSLRTITGGNTCQEKRTDIDFWSRYANTPVREAGNGFYWGADGMVVGSNVVKFWWRNEPTPDKFWQETNTAVTVQPLSAFDGSVSSPTPQLMTAYTPYANHPILWGISLLQDDGWVYVYGSASMDSTKARKLFLARVDRASLANFGAWQFRTSSGGWSGSQSDAAPVSSTFEPTMSYSVKKIHGTYWLFQREPGLNGGDIVAHPATTAWGFTNRAVTLWIPPEGNHAASDYLLHYDVRVHDGINDDADDLVLSYNVNTTAVSIGCRGLNDHDGSIYRPRFINVPAEKLLPSRAAAVTNGSGSGYSSPPVVTSGIDNQWYDSWAYTSHCPPLTKSTGLSSTTDPDGDVHLSWNEYGRDMWYWLESRDATAGTAWKRSDFWMTLPYFDTNPITSTAVNGHTFQYRVVPFANGPGGQEAPTSNTVSVVARVALPSAPTGVTVTTPTPKNGTATVRWNKVTYPHAHNFYRVFYWDKTAGQTSTTGTSTGWLGEDSTWTTLTLKKGHLYGFDVQAQNIAGNGPRSANVTATP